MNTAISASFGVTYPFERMKKDDIKRGGGGKRENVQQAVNSLFYSFFSHRSKKSICPISSSCVCWFTKPTHTTYLAHNDGWITWASIYHTLGEKLWNHTVNGVILWTECGADWSRMKRSVADKRLTRPYRRCQKMTTWEERPSISFQISRSLISLRDLLLHKLARAHTRLHTSWS